MYDNSKLINPTERQLKIYKAHLRFKSKYEGLKYAVDKGLKRQPEGPRMLDFDKDFLRNLVKFHNVSAKMYQSILWVVKESYQSVIFELIETELMMANKFQSALDVRFKA